MLPAMVQSLVGVVRFKRDEHIVTGVTRASRRRAIAARFAIALGAAIAAGGSGCAEKAPPPPQTPATVAVPSPTPPVSAVPAGPAVELLPAAVARKYLLGTVSVGSVDRLLDNGTKLANQAVPLPMDAKGLREMLLTQAGLPPEVAANLDFSGAVGAAFVAIGDKGENGTVLAAPARGATEAQKLIDALGKPVMTRGPVTLVRSPANGSGWLYRAGNIVVLSDELEALARGAMLAIEARRPGPDDVTAAIFPEAIARAHGTDVKSALTKVLNEAREQQRTSGTGQAVDDHTMDALTELFGLIADASSAELGLVADPVKGLVLRARLLPRQGTRLESVAREVRPYVLDPSVLGEKQGRFVVGASSIGPFWRNLFNSYRDRLAADKQKGASAALAFFDATLGAMGGDTSGAVWLLKEAPYLTGGFSSSLKDSAAAAKAASALSAMDQAAFTAFMRAQLGNQPNFEWTAKKETVGKLKALRYTIKIKKGTAVDSEAVRSFMGKSFDVYWTVHGTRILVTMGRDAKQRLTALAAGKPPASVETSGPFVDAQAATKGRDTFYYVDLAPMVALAGKLSPGEPRMAMIARAATGPIPMIFTAGGDGVGKVWAMDLTLPVAAFSSIGALVASGIGAAK